jgi:aspartyl/asparaginyl beta-hydroxylase (cupin superfamily)
MELYPDPVAANGFVDTKGLERCPHTRQALARFECELETARFLRLGAGSSIREHRDHKLGYEDGIVRVHVPVLTNDKVTFMLGGEFVRMLPGEAWYLNFNLPHSVRNGSEEDRVHLVVDCVVNDWLRGLLLD